MNTRRLWNAGLHSLMVIVLALALLPFGPGAARVQAESPDLFFSEYIEGTSNNKALEIFNNTGAAVDLAAGSYNVQMFFNGSASAGLTINLTGTVAHGDVFVLAHSSAAAAILAQADQTNGAGWYNGDDAVVLRKGTTVIDSIGQVGFDPGTEWGSGLTSTADNTLRRKASITAGDSNPTDVFDPSLEWDGYATDTFDGLGSHTVDGGGPVDQAPAVSSTSPANGATGVALDQSIQVVFSEPVNVTDPWYTLSCSVSGAVSAAVSGGPESFLIDPFVDFDTGETCTLTVLASAVTDQDAIDPPDNMAADVTVSFTTVMPVVDYCVVGAPYVTPIPTVQGTGDISPLAGQTVTVRGVVVADYEGPTPTLRGFYIQDPVGDGDPLTSDGLFVFNNNNNNVSLGSLVTVTGAVSEFNGQTQVTAAAGSIQDCGPGAAAPVAIGLPFPSLDYLERYEGMLVTLPQTLYVTEHFQLGRFGQVVLSSGGRLAQPTNVTAPGAPALALQAQNNLNRIILDDTLNNQNPDPIIYGRGGQPLAAGNTLRGGDTITGLTGVLTYTWAGNAASGNAYRVRPLAQDAGVVNFEAANPRPETPAETGGKVRAAALNLLNYFNTFSGCTAGVGGAPTDCRGANNLTEFNRQWVKTAAAILAMDPAVLGVIEIENDGYGPTSALQHLVDQLNAASAPGRYAFIDADAGTGQVNALGTDAIKVGLLYQPALVTPTGLTAALNSEAFVNGGDGAPRNRPALAQAFTLPDGGTFVMVVNHLKSKGSACDAPDAGDGQGNCNAVRVFAAHQLAQWLAADPTGTGDPDVLIVGDLNAYAKEDPITTLQGYGYANMIEAFLGPDAYSYVFDGQWGYLDHALASPTLAAQVTGVAEFHINADEPSVLDYNTEFKSSGQVDSLFSPDMYRVSDHDPVIVGLDVNAPPAAGTLSVSPNPQRAGAPVTAALTFTDPDPLDSHTALFDWGDGTTSAGAVSGYSASASHSYAAPGLYTVTATVTDPYGQSASAAFQYVVIYNASSFVTGGGWIPVPGGRLGFDFSAKYQKNHPAPIGSFSMSRDSGGFSFQSSSFDWLVVSGPAVFIQGSGSLNGQPGFGYLISALDGNPDRVRFQVWDATGSIVFDTQPGDGFTAAPTTALGGGTIRIR